MSTKEECRLYYQKNKAKISAIRKVYYEEHKYEIAAKRALNPEKARERARARYHKNRDAELLRHKAYKKANKGKMQALKAKRHAAKMQRTPKWLTPLHYQQIEMFYNTAQRLTKEFGIPMEVDHIVPLQSKIVSGLHVPWNLQVISQNENRKKYNRL